MKREMSIEAGHPGHCGDSDSSECEQRLASETGETQIEPHHVGLQLPDREQQAPGICHAVKRPATNYRKSVQFRLWCGKIVSQDRVIKTRNFLELKSDVVTVIVEYFTAGFERSYITIV